MRLRTSKTDNFNELLDLSSKVLDNSTVVVDGTFKKDPDSIEALVLSRYWPAATAEAAVVRTEKAQDQRAKSIISSYVSDLHDKKFLDMGCGNGKCALAATTAALAVGYDKTPHENWKKSGNIKLTTDFNTIVEQSPYDVILVYDVFDHVQDDEVEEFMRRLAAVSRSGTVLHVRCHPWTSIHGGHLYEKLNKAYAHLFLTDTQLAKYQTEFVRKITRPMKTYTDTWRNHGFKIEHEETHKTNWEGHLGDFFQQPDVALFINKQSPQQVLGTAGWQKQVLPIEFIDYTLKYVGAKK